MHKRFVSLIAACTILVTAASASAANSIFMTLTGQKSGAVRGGVTQKGREGSISILGVDDEVASPRDAASGLPTGQRQHKPLRVTMEIDQSLPVLYRMVTTNENITTLELRYWRASPDGKEAQFYTVRLTNASISDVHTTTSNDATRATVVDVSFTYQKIDWTWTEGGVSATDSWR